MKAYFSSLFTSRTSRAHSRKGLLSISCHVLLLAAVWPSWPTAGLGDQHGFPTVVNVHLKQNESQKTNKEKLHSYILLPLSAWIWKDQTVYRARPVPLKWAPWGGGWSMEGIRSKAISAAKKMLGFPHTILRSLAFSKCLKIACSLGLGLTAILIWCIRFRSLH